MNQISNGFDTFTVGEKVKCDLDRNIYTLSAIKERTPIDGVTLLGHDIYLVDDYDNVVVVFPWEITKIGDSSDETI